MTHFPRETSDAGPGPLAAMGAIAFLLLAAGAFLRPLQAALAGRVARADSGRRPVPSVLPPAPRLQARPADDLARLRAAEDDRLNGWAWADRRAGLARVPIARAMDALARGEVRP